MDISVESASQVGFLREDPIVERIIEFIIEVCENAASDSVTEAQAIVNIVGAIRDELVGEVGSS